MFILVQIQYYVLLLLQQGKPFIFKQFIKASMF
jgi:hypothetical protein